MIINANSAPFDRQFNSDIPGHAGVENLLTIGVGSYIVECNVLLWATNINSPHILVGRFNSWAGNLKISIGGNHASNNVTTFPIDTQNVVDDTFGVDESRIKSLPYNRPNHFQVIVGHDVWIGEGVRVMGGVKIGNGAVIGANAVVAKNIPPYAIAVGNPARIIKYRFDEETIKKFLAVKWWNWSLEKIAENLPIMNDVEKFLKLHYSPELDTFPEDEISRRLSMWGGGIYHLIADFRAQMPLWPKVVRDFAESDFKDKLLVIWLDKNATDDDFNRLSTAANLLGDAKNNIASVKANTIQTFSPAALRKGTHFITTREMTTLEALDYLWDTDVKIVSALDDGIFA